MIVMLLLAVFLSIALLSYLLLFNGRFFGREGSIIDAPIEVISEDLSDLTNWQHWLPWLLFEPDAQVTYENSNTGVMSILPSCLVWNGKRIKEGFLSLEAARPNSPYFHTLLEAPAFYPSDVHFNIDLTKQKDRTLISIQITGKLPFFKRWKQTNYKFRANKDAELALLKLLSHLSKYNTISDQEYIAPAFEWLNRTTLDHVDAVTRPFSVRDQPMSQKMDQGFHDLITSLGSENQPTGPAFALYKKVDVIHHYFSGRLGIPVHNLVPCELSPERIVLKGTYLHLRYSGSYQHLSLAWHVLYSFMRLDKQQHNRRLYGVEFFEVGPTHTDSAKEFVTSIYLPIK